MPSRIQQKNNKASSYTAWLSPSHRTHKKWCVTLLIHDDESGGSPDRKRTIHFGDDRYEDFTQHKDDDRKQRYLTRHSGRERWEDPTSAGFWSRRLLWEEPSLPAAIRTLQRDFPITVHRSRG